MFDMIGTESLQNKTIGVQSLETALRPGHCYWAQGTPVWPEVCEPGVVWQGRLERWTEAHHRGPVRVSLGIWVLFSRAMETGVWVSPCVMCICTMRFTFWNSPFGKETVGGL